MVWENCQGVLLDLDALQLLVCIEFSDAIQLCSRETQATPTVNEEFGLTGGSTHRPSQEKSEALSRMCDDGIVKKALLCGPPN